MKKNTPIIIVLVVLFFVGWILVESNMLPFINSTSNTPEVETPAELPESPIVAAPEGKCYIGGCSGQICSDVEGISSTCEYRPEYSCYRDAKCERQSSGQCGWTTTSELSMCLSNAGSL